MAEKITMDVMDFGEDYCLVTELAQMLHVLSLKKNIPNKRHRRNISRI